MLVRSSTRPVDRPLDLMFSLTVRPPARPPVRSDAHSAISSLTLFPADMSCAATAAAVSDNSETNNKNPFAFPLSSTALSPDIQGFLGIASITHRHHDDDDGDDE